MLYAGRRFGVEGVWGVECRVWDLLFGVLSTEVGTYNTNNIGTRPSTRSGSGRRSTPSPTLLVMMLV